jgi:hypothetical protein
MSPTLSPETQRVLRNHGAVISYAPSRMPAVLSFVLTAALFLGSFLAIQLDQNTEPSSGGAMQNSQPSTEGSAEQ